MRGALQAFVHATALLIQVATGLAQAETSRTLQVLYQEHERHPTLPAKDAAAYKHGAARSAAHIQQCLAVYVDEAGLPRSRPQGQLKAATYWTLASRRE